MPAQRYGPLTLETAAVLFGRVRSLQPAVDAHITRPFAVFAPASDGGAWQASRAVWQTPGQVLALGWADEEVKDNGGDSTAQPPTTLLDVSTAPPLLLLQDATQRLCGCCVDRDPAARLLRGAPWNTVHRRARLLSVFYGTVYFVSRSIAANMGAGDHFFSVDGRPPVRLRVGRDGRVDGCLLTWRVQRGYEYARLRNKPLYLLASVDARAGRAVATAGRTGRLA